MKIVLDYNNKYLEELKQKYWIKDDNLVPTTIYMLPYFSDSELSNDCHHQIGENYHEILKIAFKENKDDNNYIVNNFNKSKHFILINCKDIVYIETNKNLPNANSPIYSIRNIMEIIKKEAFENLPNNAIIEIFYERFKNTISWFTLKSIISEVFKETDFTIKISI